MRCERFGYLTPEEANLRVDIFIKEQEFSVEFDGFDRPSASEHLVFYDEDGGCAAVCRVYCESGEWHIGRIAVRKDLRGGGRGREVLAAAETLCRERGAESVSLSAQCRARGFYESCGYRAVGETYFDEYCEHIRMVKRL